MIDVALYGYLQGKGWKHQVLTTGSWTAPIDGVYFLNGVGAGAAGRVGADSADRPGGGSGESCLMYPVFLTMGKSVSITIGAGGTGDGGAGGNTSFGSYLTLYGAGKSGDSTKNNHGGGKLSADGNIRAYNTNASMDSSYKKSGANATSSNTGASYSGLSDFSDGVKAGSYMWGGAGSKYAAGGNGNASGSGGAGGIGAGGGSGTTAAGAGGDGYLEIMWQE